MSIMTCHCNEKSNNLIIIYSQIIWFEGHQLPDTLVPDREDAECEVDDTDVVLSSDDERGELSSENDDDDDAGDDYCTNRPSIYR